MSEQTKIKLRLYNLNASKDVRWMHLNNEEQMVKNKDIEAYIKAGWLFGRLTQPNLGRHQSEESKEKNRLAHLGKIP